MIQKYGGVAWDWEKFFKPEKLQTLTAKGCAFKIRGDNGKPMVGEAKLNYLESKYKEKHESKTYNFGKFTSGIVGGSNEGDEENTKKPKFDLKNLDFTDERHEVNPVKTDTTDLSYLFDNEDAITYTFKNKK